MNTSRRFRNGGWKRLVPSLLLLGSILSATAQFTEVNAGFTNVSAGRALWGDYDNDGDLDVLITGFIAAHNNGNTTLYRNDGGGVFTPVSTPFLQVGYSAGAWGDYDADGNLDLVISGMLSFSGDGASQEYHNNGNGSFSLTTTLAASWFGSECWGDYDQDGDQDLLQGGRTKLVLYRNDAGALNNSGVTFPNPGDLYGHAIWADYDNDGDLDIYVAGDSAYPARSRILRNDGNGVFTIVTEFYHRFYNAAAWGDYDNDGDLDLAISGYDIGADGFTKILRYDGGTNWVETAISLPGTYYSSLAWGDYDNDGRLDLLLGGMSDTTNITRLYRNDGGDVFTNVWTAPQELTDAVVSWGDFDNDGDLDFIICGETNGVKITKLFRNDSAVSNTPPTAPGNLSVVKQGRTALLSWSPASDAQQTGGLSYNVRLGTTPGGINRISPRCNPVNGFRRVPELGNAGLRTNYYVTNLTAGNYYWSVQAIDHAFAGSAFATEVSFTIAPPVITNQPQPLTISAGQTATFTVGASGNEPLSYQWRFNNVNLPGATNISLVLSTAQFVNQGYYSVAVSDVIGTTISTNVFLTVNSAPVITSQPIGQTIALGGGVSFSAGVIGNTPFAYQWQFNGTNIDGATNPTLVLLNVQITNAGLYSVLVTNPIGFTLSSNALLNVYQPGQGVQTVSAPGAADMVYDSARDLIYITSGSSILRYHLGSNIFLTPFVLGTGLNLWQVDLSFNGNTLVAADYSGGGRSIYVVGLQNNTNWQVLLPGSPFGDNGTFSVAFGHDNAALITGDFPGSGPVSLRRYAAVAGTNSSLGTVFMRSLVGASGDGSVIGIIEGATSAGNLHKYSVAAQVITNSIGNGWFCWIAPGVNKNGSQFAYATDGGTFIYNANLAQIGTIGNYFSDRPVGVVYHPSADLVFFVWGGSSYVRAYDTTTLMETTRYDFGTSFSAATGTAVKNSVRIRISRDGSLLMVNVGNAVKYLRWAAAPPQIASQPANTSAPMNGGASFSVTASGTPPFGYQWFFETNALSGATNATLTLSNLQPTQFGGYSVVVFSPYGYVTSSVAQLTWNGVPYITQQPQNIITNAGWDPTFNVTALGTSLSYQWRFSGVDILNAANPWLTLGVVQLKDEGQYTVVVSNPSGSVTSSVATLTVLAAAPTFIQQPQSQTNVAGESVLFQAFAVGTDPISYQWRFQGTNLAGYTGTSLTVQNLQNGNTGDYTVTASNMVGVTTSAVATVTVTPVGPTITTEPASRAAPRGAEVLFSMAATGSEPFAYQWRFNGTDIPGATVSSLLLTNVQTNDVGGYSVVVTNDYGSDMSITATLSLAAPPGFLWARRGGGTSSDAGNCVAVDAAGNAYVAGYFASTATFASSNLASFGANDIFVAKYDPAGQMLWLRQAGGTGNDVANAIAVDTNGNVFLTGQFNSTADFSGVSLTNAGSGDIFIAKYDTDGNVAWARRYGGTGSDQGNAIAVDAFGNLFVTGYFNGTVAFGTTNLTAGGSGDVFVAKFDGNGDALWARRAGGATGFETGLALALDKVGNIFVAGYFMAISATFDTITLSNAVATSGLSDIFVAKYDANGSVLWAKRAGSISNDQALGLAMDPVGNVFVTGYYSGTATFDGVTLTSVSSSVDIFLAKYDSAGNVTWAKSAGGSSSDYGNALAVDLGGNAYLVGRFAGLATFGTTNLTASGGDDIFVVAYSPAGNVLWARKAGGSGSDIGLGVAAEALGNIYFTGSFASGAATFGHIPLATAGSLDFHLAKLVVVDSSAPPAFTMQPSNQVAQAGADVTFTSGFVGSPPVSFQWLLFGTTILGATNSTLILNNASPVQVGDYSVILGNGNGSVTSAVATLTVTVEPDFLWALHGGGITNDEILGVVSDPNGNTYVAGYFSGAAAIAGQDLVSHGGEDIFIARYDSAHNPVWVRTAGGTGNDRANALVLDSTGTNVIVVGQFSGTADFSGLNLVSAGGTDMFVARYDTDGNRNWVLRGGGSGNDAALGITLASNAQIFTTGYFQGSATIAGTGLTSAGANDMFLAKYNNVGINFGARSGGGSSDDRGRAVTSDGAGNVYVAGAFSGAASFSGAVLTSNAGYDAFVVKYDLSMTRIWARRAGTSVPTPGGGYFDDEAGAIAADRDGNVFVSGYFLNQAAFGSFTNTAASINQPDIFLAKYDGNGNVLWTKQAGGVGTDLANALATDFGGNAYLAGSFSGAAVFSPFSVMNVGGTDAFVAMYDAAGRLVKVRHAGGVGNDAGQSVAVDGRGNALVGGMYSASAAFGSNAVANVGGRDVFVTKVSFFDPDALPVITSQPVGVSTSVGSNGVVSVGVSSSTPLRCQWFFNGSPLSGATNVSLILSNVQFVNLGPYFVTVSNAFGAVTSATAIVRIEQAPEVLWTVKHGGTGDDQGLAVAVDVAANVYVVGIFSGTVAFGTSNLVSAGGTDIFFAKYNSFGGLLWAKKYGGGNADSAQCLAVDAAGNVFMTGFFTGTAAFGNSNLVSSGNTDIFVAKHDSAGNILWLKRAGNSQYEQGSSVTTDSAGNAYMTGSYYDSATFGSVVLTNFNNTNFFVAKYDPAGNVLWAKSETGTGPCQGNGVAVDSATNVYVTGFLLGSANFGSGVITNTSGSPAGGGSATVFVAKYNATGALQWAKKGGTNGLGYGQSIVADAAGNVFATSYKRDYGGGVMLTKYDGGGNVLWVRTNTISCCTGDYISVNGLALDATGNPLLAGGMTGSGPFESLSLSTPQQGFIVKYRSDTGVPFWAQKSGQMGYAAALDAVGSAYLAGRFSGTTLFGTSSNLVSSGGNDAFLVKFGVRAPTITLPPADRLVVAGSNTMLQVTTAGAPATYQWQLNGMNIPGATGASYLLNNFSTTQAGRYAVVVQSAAGWATSSVAGIGMIPVLRVVAASNSAVLNWDGTFTLQMALNATGPFTDLPSASSPFTNFFLSGEPRRFFRLRVADPLLTGSQSGNGTFLVGVGGSPGRRYIVQASTNLVDWLPVQFDVSPFTLQDSNPAAWPQRYFRALLSP